MRGKNDNPGDDVLCQLARAGDEAARTELYRRHAPAVMTLAMRMLCQRSCAEEVLQDTFVKAFTHLGEFRHEARFGTWLRRIAVNQCLGALRSPWRQRGRVLGEVSSPAESRDHQIDLTRALEALDPISRAVVWLHDVEGYTHVEIAALMSRTASFSKSRLARGHVALRAALEPDEESSPCMPIPSNSSL
jgi:RNA polymerase sigma-70 factor (ECF subfamily)